MRHRVKVAPTVWFESMTIEIGFTIHSLHSVIVAATPVFAPADADLAPAAFATFLSSVAAANTAVATTIADWHTAVAARTDLVVTIKERALRALNRVKSNRAWDLQLPAVKAAIASQYGTTSPAAIQAKAVRL